LPFWPVRPPWTRLRTIANRSQEVVVGTRLEPLLDSRSTSEGFRLSAIRAISVDRG
jgi:hypothetical protein